MAARITRLLTIRSLLQSRKITPIRTCQSTATQAVKISTIKDNREPTFDELLDSSKFFATHPVGRKAIAEIIAERDGNLYVDFGGKFHAVVPRPTKNGHLYVKGKWVEVVVEDLEVTSHFLGNNKDTSLLEAQVKLVGMSHYKPLPSDKSDVITEHRT